ncbi:MAG: hypothetical protein WC476_12600, partial [Phycisphaerae bacterium]
IVTREKIKQRMENIGKEEKPEFIRYSVNKDMELKEILDRARSNQSDLSGSIEQSDAFGKELWEAVRDNTREAKPQEIMNTAMFLAEKANVSLADINDYLDRKLKDTVKKEEIQKVKDKLAGLRINYVRSRQAVLLTEEVKIGNQIKLEGDQDKKKDLESRSVYIKTEIAKNEKELASIKQLLITKTEMAIAQKEAELSQKKDADAAKIKQEIASLKEEKEYVEKLLSSAEKLDQAKKKAQDEFKRESEALFGADKKLEGILAKLSDPKTPTLQREQLRVYLIAKITDLSRISIILDEQRLQGKSLKAWSDEIEKLYKEAENIRQEKANAYRQEKDKLGIWMLTGKEPKSKSKDNAKKEKATTPTPDDLLNHFEKNKDYLEPDEREREQKSLMFLSKVYQRQGIMDWQELLKTSPPEIAAYLDKTKTSETEQLKALSSVLSVVSPSKNTQVKASIFNLTFGILEFFRSKEAKSEVYQQFIRSYFSTMSILAGDIFRVIEKEEMGLSDKDKKELKEIESILRKDGAVSKLPYNLIQIQKAIEQAVKDKDEKAFLGLLALREQYLLAYTQALLEAEFTYLSFLRTNTKDTRFSISTNLIVSVILLFSNLLSNVLPDQDNENKKVKTAENILKIMDSQVRKIEENRNPKDDVELTQTGNVLIRVALNDKGQTVYKYVTPEQYYDQTLRQNKIYEDKDTIISTTTQPTPFDQVTNPDRGYTYSGVKYYRLGLDDWQDGTVKMDVIYNWILNSKAVSGKFEDPAEQRITLNLGRLGSTAQNLQATYIRANEGDRVVVAFSHTQNGVTMTIGVELDEKGKAQVMAGARKLFQTEQTRGSVALFASQQAVSFDWNQRSKEWEVRFRSDYNYQENSIRINFEQLKHSSVGQLAAGMGVTFQDNSVIPYTTIQGRGLLGVDYFNAKLGWDIKENKPVVLLSTQNNSGLVRPYANLNSTGENTTTLQAGARFNQANGYHFDASGLMDSNSSFGASIDVGTSSISLRTTAYEDNNRSFGLRINPFKLFDQLGAAKQYSGMESESYKPQGNILFVESNTALGEFRSALRRALLAKDDAISFTDSFLGLFTKGSVEQMYQDLEKLGVKVTQEQVKRFLAVKAAFDKENVKLFPGKFSELISYMIKAKELTTENGSRIKDYIYNGNAKSTLDISRSLDLWELAYFAGLIKEHGEDYAKKTLSRYIRIKKEVGAFLGKGFNPADEKDVRALRLFNSLSENTRNAEEFIAKLKDGLIEVIAKLYELENKGKKLDLSSDEGLEALNSWLMSIEKNGCEAKDDIQILKNTLVLMQRGVSREEALARAKVIHEAMFKKRIQNYPENRLSRILDIEKVVGSLEVAIDLSSLIRYQVQNENLQKAWELMKAYQAKPYYRYLIYMQYVSSSYDGTFKELLPYIFQVEEAARQAEVELDFVQSSRDFRMLAYWAKRAREFEQGGAKDVIAKLKVVFLDKNNFHTFLKDNAVLDNYLRGKNILGEVQGENKKMLDKALDDAKAFLKIALSKSGVADQNKYLARINTYKFVATGLVNEKANNGVDTIYIPYSGYLTERNNAKLAQL